MFMQKLRAHLPWAKTRLVKDDLEKQKQFCLIPWIHMYVTPDGNISACCMENYGSIRYGNWNVTSIQKAWNSSAIKKFRKDMMKGRKRSDVCSRCYLREEHEGKSHRTEINRRFEHLITPCLEKTRNNGSVDEMKLAFWDFRFSNVCNLRCRTCGPIFSSSWVPDAKKLKWALPKTYKKSSASENFADVEQQIDFVEEIYFAGGEPLLSPEHYRILELLIERKRTHVKLNYNTNCTQLALRDKSVLPLWKHFQNLHISPSIDDTGKRAELLRKGTRWDVLVRNIQTIRQEVPWATVVPTLTISAFNVFSLGETIETLIAENIIGPDRCEFQLNMVDYPEHFHVGVLTDDLRQVALARLEKAEAQLTKKYGPHFESLAVVKGHLAQDRSQYRAGFVSRAKELDALRDENSFEIFSDLKGLLDAPRS